jgi:hypothetical protein
MTFTRAEVENLVVRVQDAFLDTPGLRLSPAQAATFFGLPFAACEGVLGALADARVLAVTPGGGYQRLYPSASPRRSRTQAA